MDFHFKITEAEIEKLRKGVIVKWVVAYKTEVHTVKMHYVKDQAKVPVEPAKSSKDMYDELKKQQKDNLAVRDFSGQGVS